MPTQKIPLKNSPDKYKFRITLVKERFIFHIRFNNFSGFWELSISDSDDNRIVSGITLQLGVLFLQFTGLVDVLPKGDLYLVRKDGLKTDVSKNELGDTVVMAFITPDE